MSKLPPTLQKYVNFIASAGRPVSFKEIVSATPGYNGFGHLKRRGLVKNIVPGYTSIRDEPYTGPRTPRYVLTATGRSYADDRYDFTGVFVDTREFCSCCVRPNPLSFHVPDDVWERAVPEFYRGKVLCIICFDVMATLNGVNWAGRPVEFFPVSGIDGRELVDGKSSDPDEGGR